MTRSRVLTAAGLACALLTAASAPANDSLYTSIRRADCRRPPREIVATYAARDLGVQECPAPRGWRVFVVASDRSTWIDIRSKTLTWSSEDAVVYDSPIGHFPSVGSPRIEWRRGASAEPMALVFRVTAQQRDDPRSRVSRLFVVRLEPTRACILGAARTNAEARALADSEKKCETKG